jgi:hypothetical protein
VPVSVTVHPDPAGFRLGAGFVGFSYEKRKLASPFLRADNAPLVALWARLGPGLLRVGGNSVDQTPWTPDGPGLTEGQIAPADVARLAGFLRAAHWRVLYGLDFATANPADLAAEAANAAETLGDSLQGFELGNEPDCYHVNGLRPPGYTFEAFLAEWRACAAAIRVRVPGAVFTGPASAYDLRRFTLPFAKAAGPELALLTQHYYRGNGQLPSSTLERLLTPDPSLPGTLQSLRGASAGLASGFRLAEANSFYGGGAPHVSDAYGTALWAIDFLFTSALNGAVGVNFHGGGKGPGYTPIADDGTAVVEVRPEYYGVALVAMIGPGRLLTTTVVPGGLALSAYAVAMDAGGIGVVVVNRDPGRAAEVTLDLGAVAASADLTLLTGAGLESAEGTVLNGAAILADGTWSPRKRAPVAVNGTTLVLTAAPASAVLARAH